MKKMLITLSAALLAMALYGCGGSSSSSADSSADSGSGSEAAVADTTADWSSFPQEILKIYDSAPATYEELPTVTPDELYQKIQDSEQMVMVDTNGEGVYANEGHIPGAINLPWNIDGFTQDPDLPRGVPLHFYCSCAAEEDSGSMALSAVTDYGYRNIILLKGGIPAWQEAGYELATS